MSLAEWEKMKSKRSSWYSPSTSGKSNKRSDVSTESIAMTGFTYTSAAQDAAQALSSSTLVSSPVTTPAAPPSTPNLEAKEKGPGKCKNPGFTKEDRPKMSGSLQDQITASMKKRFQEMHAGDDSDRS